jgi:hypothetical protein
MTSALAVASEVTEAHGYQQLYASYFSTNSSNDIPLLK